MRKMVKLFPILGVSLLLAGCVSTGTITSIEADHERSCAREGNGPGTRLYGDCLQTRSINEMTKNMLLPGYSLWAH